MIRFAFFDAKPYDRPSFDRYGAEHGIEFKYFETRLCVDTVELARGFDVTEEVDSYGKDDFRGIHGWIVGVKRHSVNNPTVIGYDMKI